MTPNNPESTLGTLLEVDLTQELVQETGIPKEQITSEMLEKYKLAKSVNAKLDFLAVKAEQDIAKKISAANKLLESQDTQAGDITPEDVTTAAKDVVDAAKDDIQKAIEDTPDAVAEWAAGKATEKLQSSLSGLPFGIGDKFSGVLGNIGEMIKKIFVMLTGAFGGLGITKWLKSKFGWETPKVPDLPTPPIAVTPMDTPILPVETTLVTPDNTPILPEIKTPEISQSNQAELLFTSGNISIISLSAEKVDSGDSAVRNTVYSEFSKLSYQEVLDGKVPTRPLEYENNESYGNIEVQVANALKSKTTQDIIRIGLPIDSLRSILMKDGQINEKYASYFMSENTSGIERVQEILTSIENGSFQISSLSYREICIFYSLSLPSLGDIIQSGFGLVGGAITSTLGVGNDFLSSLPEGKISKNIVKILLEKTKNLDGGGKSLLQDNTGFEALFTDANLTPEEQSQITELESFKDWVMTELPNISQLGLSDPNTKETFLKNLNYSWIIVLYELFHGQQELPQNPINLIILIPSIRQIIGSTGENAAENANTAGIYMGSYVSNMLSNSSLGLSEDQITMLKILGQKGTVEYVNYSLGKANELLGLGTGLLGVDSYELAAGAVGTGVVSNIFANRLIKSGIEAGKISRLGILLKRFAWFSMISGVMIGGVKFLGDKNTQPKFSEDLTNAIISGDVEKVKRVMENREKSIHSYTVNGKEMKESSYPGEQPYFIYDGEIYIPSIVTPNTEIDMSSFSSAFSSGMNLLGLKENDGTYIDETGKKVNLFPVTTDESGNMVFGESGYKISMKELSDASLTIQIQDNLVQMANKVLDGSPGELGSQVPIIGEYGTTTKYIPLSPLGNGTSYISLVSIGKVEDIIKDNA